MANVRVQAFSCIVNVVLGALVFVLICPYNNKYSKVVDNNTDKL